MIFFDKIGLTGEVLGWELCQFRGSVISISRMNRTKFTLGTVLTRSGHECGCIVLENLLVVVATIK